MKSETAIFGGGCFWCTEAVFLMLRGVKSAVPGYCGGTKENPTYEEVSSGNTGHAEAIKIDFDPREITYENLLTVFFGSHDPTTLNRQGNDIGTQYRSVIFYTNEEQRATAQRFIRDLNSSNKEGAPIVTEVEPFSRFYDAEDYHKNYYERNKNQSYCQLVINPKLARTEKEFYELLKIKKK